MPIASASAVVRSGSRASDRELRDAVRRPRRGAQDRARGRAGRSSSSAVARRDDLDATRRRRRSRRRAAGRPMLVRERPEVRVGARLRRCASFVAPPLGRLEQLRDARRAAARKLRPRGLQDDGRRDRDARALRRAGEHLARSPAGGVTLTGSAVAPGDALELPERADDDLGRRLPIEAAPGLLGNDLDPETAADERRALAARDRRRRRSGRARTRAPRSRRRAAGAPRRRRRGCAGAGSRAAGRTRRRHGRPRRPLRPSPAGRRAGWPRTSTISSRRRTRPDRPSAARRARRASRPPRACVRPPTSTPATCVPGGELAPRAGEGEADEDREEPQRRRDDDRDRSRSRARAPAPTCARCVERRIGAHGSANSRDERGSRGW